MGGLERWLRAVVLMENPGAVLHKNTVIYMVAYPSVNSVPEDPMPSSLGTKHTRDTHMYMQENIFKGMGGLSC